MARKKHLSTEEKTQICTLLQEGWTQIKLCKKFNCSQSTISDLWSKYKEKGSVARQKGSGRRRATTARQDRELRKIAKNMKKSTSSEMNGEWKKSGVSVSDRTLRNRLHEMKYSYAKMKKKPFLTAKHKKNRLEWAKEHEKWTVHDWSNVVFSDESRICLGYGDDGARFTWRRPEEKFDEGCLVSTTKFPQSIMIWGCMSYQGVGRLKVMKTTVDSNAYLELLEYGVLPTIEDHFGDAECIFQDDNASCHRSKKVNDYLSSIGITRMEWPPNSPDCNPIENLWGILKKKVKALNPTTKIELKEVIIKSWAEINENDCKKLVESMTRRIKAIIKAKGGPTKY